uniref:stage II sporulation protein M n=1 Tax=Haloarcula sediminis TaxID=3111777 RepID=UPI002D79D877
ALATVTRVKRRISDVKPICLFAFYRDNAVVAVASSETTVPIDTISTVRTDGLVSPGFRYFRGLRPLLFGFKIHIITCLYMQSVSNKPIIGPIVNLWPEMSASVGMFILGVLSGSMLATTGTNGANGSQIEVSLTFTGLLLNNATVYFLMLLGSITFGVTTIFLLFNTGLLVGTVTTAGLRSGSNLTDILVLIGTHGIVELSGFLIGSAVGLRIARNMLQYLRKQRDSVIEPEALRQYTILACFGLCIIIVAAFIEAEITRQVYRLLQ